MAEQNKIGCFSTAIAVLILCGWFSGILESCDKNKSKTNLQITKDNKNTTEYDPGILTTPGQEMIVVFKSPEAYQEATDIYRASGKKVTKALMDRAVAIVPCGTKASLLDISYIKGMSQVLILEGDSQGVKGWVPIEYHRSGFQSPQNHAVNITQLDNYLKIDEVNSIKIKNKLIKVGDSADHVFAILKPEDKLKDVDVIKKSNESVGLKIIHHYRVDGKIFDIILTLPNENGPYRVKKIMLKSPPNSSSDFRKTISQVS